MKTYVTFGFGHKHTIKGVLFDKDTIAVINCESSSEGRAKAFEIFGPKFCFEYYESEFDRIDMKYFPKGFVEVPE